MAAVYRCYDKDYALLYVGASSNFSQRLKRHRHTKRWFKDVARIELQRFDTLAAAYRAESIAIIVEKPLHNELRYGVLSDQLATKAASDRDEHWMRVMGDWAMDVLLRAKRGPLVEDEDD